MASALFVWVFAQEQSLSQLPNGIKCMIKILGETSFGIYLIHPLVMQMWNRNSVPFLPLYSNNGTVGNMFVGATLYFAICMAFCYSKKRIFFLS